MKEYDRAYFDKWYRSRLHRVSAAADVRRKVALALTTAEYFVGRPVRRVLDIGCGEAPWLAQIREMRPRAEYTGIDSSAYVVAAFGKSRNIRHGAFGDLSSLRLRGTFDLIVCSDVLHYVGEKEIRNGMWELVRLLEGIAFLEVLTSDDAVTGDLDGLAKRPASWYRRIFGSAGLTQVAPHCWLAPERREDLAALELP